MALAKIGNSNRKGIFTSKKLKGAKRGSVEWKLKCSEGHKRFYAANPDLRFIRGKDKQPRIVGSRTGEKHVFKDLESRNKHVSEGLIRANLRGERNPNWIPDRTKLKRARDGRRESDSAGHDWSLSIKKRDNWECQITNEECSGKVESHHILNWIDYPGLRYELKNGITLCHFHHPRGRKSEERLQNLFQELVEIKTQIYGK